MSNLDYKEGRGDYYLGEGRREERERTAKESKDALYVSADRCTLVRIWASGTAVVALRDSPDHIWSPPVYLTKEG